MPLTINIAAVVGLTAMAAAIAAFGRGASWSSGSPPVAAGDWNPEGSSIGTLTITAETQPILIAPAPAFLEVSISGLKAAQRSGTVYDHTFHEYDVIWTKISGPTLDPWTAPQNFLAIWNNPEVTYGKIAAVCMTKPGTYVWEAMAVDEDGNYGVQQRTFVVKAHDDVSITWGTTIVASQSGFSGAPAGTQVTTVAGLLSAIQGASGLTKVLLKAGETWSNVRLNTSGGRLDYMGKWGAGDNPVLRPGEFQTQHTLEWSTNDKSTQVTVTDIDILGFYDPETETGGLGGASALYWRNRVTSVVKCFNAMDIRNCTEIQASCNFAPCAIMFHNLARVGWADYGFFCANNSAGKYAFLGTLCAQPPGGLNGIDGPKQNISNQHGPIRIEECLWIVCDGLDLFSNNDWSGSAAQHCLRLLTGQSVTNPRLHVGRCVMENSYMLITGEGENTTAEDRPGNCRFNRLLLIGGATLNQTQIGWHRGGATFENILHIQANAPNLQQASPVTFYRLNPNNPQGSNNSEPVAVRNVSVVSLLNAANENRGPMTLSEVSGFTDVTVEASARVAPNSATPVTIANLDLTTLTDVTPRYEGRHFNYKHAQGSNGSIPANGTLDVPYTSLTIVDAYGNGPGTVPNQAYWGTADLAKSKLKIGGQLREQANGDFTITATASALRITNTSGGAWSAGTYYFQPDRSNLRATELPTATEYATPNLVPQALPEAGCVLLDPGGSDRYAISDFAGGLRPLGSQDAGVWQVTA